MMTPIVLPSAITGNEVVIHATDNPDRLLIVTRTPDGKREAQATIDVASLLMLDYIPGFTVKYTKPIEIPKYLGAVIERVTEMGRPRSEVIERYVRWAHDSDSSVPWASRTGTHVRNDDVAAILANGGYEREPEFPQRTP